MQRAITVMLTILAGLTACALTLVALPVFAVAMASLGLMRASHFLYSLTHRTLEIWNAKIQTTIRSKRER